LAELDELRLAISESEWEDRERLLEVFDHLVAAKLPPREDIARAIGLASALTEYTKDAMVKRVGQRILDALTVKDES